jgi:hypothetical protein
MPEQTRLTGIGIILVGPQDRGMDEQIVVMPLIGSARHYLEDSLPPGEHQEKPSSLTIRMMSMRVVNPH